MFNNGYVILAIIVLISIAFVKWTRKRSGYEDALKEVLNYETVTQRIINGEKVSTKEILESDETSVKNALLVMNDSSISPDDLDEQPRKVYEIIKTRGDLVTEIH